MSVLHGEIIVFVAFKVIIVVENTESFHEILQKLRCIGSRSWTELTFSLVLEIMHVFYFPYFNVFVNTFENELRIFHTSRCLKIF